MTAPAHRGPVICLGPQRRDPSLGAALGEFRDPGDPRPVALLSAGWEELEHEDGELRAHLGCELHNLGLHGRALQVFDEDPDLLGRLQAMHDELSELQRLYRGQLRHLLAATRELLARDATPALLEDHCATAIENLRNLDRRQLDSVSRARDRAAQDLDLEGRPSLQRHRDEVRAVLGGVSALCIAGGHVGVLYNRCWMFGLRACLPETLPVFAWSAGAMVLAQQIVLFHDTPPEGQGGAELLGPGLGLLPEALVFPHAKHRLRLSDPVRVRILSQRFGPATCVAMDQGARIDWDGQALQLKDQARRLCADGTVGKAG